MVTDQFKIFWILGVHSLHSVSIECYATFLTYNTCCILTSLVWLNFNYYLCGTYLVSIGIFIHIPSIHTILSSVQIDTVKQICVYCYFIVNRVVTLYCLKFFCTPFGNDTHMLCIYYMYIQEIDKKCQNKKKFKWGIFSTYCDFVKI